MSERDELERFYVRELAACKLAWEDGALPGLADAVMLCAQANRPLPDWASEAVLKVIMDRFTGKTITGRKGRTATPIAEHRQNYIHYMRWSGIDEWRRRRDELIVKEIAPNWDAAYAAVAEMLGGTIAEGSEETIKRSYQLVEKAMKKGGGPSFYIARSVRYREKKPG